MCAPSEYWATSSGIAIESIRDNTHPALPSLVRTRFQLSILTGTGGGGGNFACSFFFFLCLDSSSVGFTICDSSSQFEGGFGAGGLPIAIGLLREIDFLLWQLFWCGFHGLRRRCDPRGKSSPDDVQLHALIDQIEAGRKAIRLGVNIELTVRRRLAHRGQIDRPFKERRSCLICSGVNNCRFSVQPSIPVALRIRTNRRRVCRMSTCSP